MDNVIKFDTSGIVGVLVKAEYGMFDNVLLLPLILLFVSVAVLVSPTNLSLLTYTHIHIHTDRPTNYIYLSSSIFIIYNFFSILCIDICL